MEILAELLDELDEIKQEFYEKTAFAYKIHLDKSKDKILYLNYFLEPPYLEYLLITRYGILTIRDKHSTILKYKE